MFTPCYPVYVACAYDSKHGEVAIKFSHPSAIERELAILLRLKEARVAGIAHVYGCCHLHPFQGITLQLFGDNLAAYGEMKLEEVVEMGKGMARVQPVPLHSLGLRLLFRSLRYRPYTT